MLWKKKKQVKKEWEKEQLENIKSKETKLNIITLLRERKDELWTPKKIASELCLNIRKVNAYLIILQKNGLIESEYITIKTIFSTSNETIIKEEISKIYRVLKAK